MDRQRLGNLPGYEVRALLPGDIDAGDYHRGRRTSNG